VLNLPSRYGSLQIVGRRDVVLDGRHLSYSSWLPRGRGCIPDAEQCTCEIWPSDLIGYYFR
jgi:hypothetical protein